MQEVPEQCTLETPVREKLPPRTDSLADVERRFKAARVAVFLDFDLTLTATDVHHWADASVETLADWIEAQFATPAAKARKADIERLLHYLIEHDGQVTLFILTNSTEPLVRCMLHLIFGVSKLPRGSIIDRRRRVRGKGDVILQLIERATEIRGRGMLKYVGPSLIIFADDSARNMVNFKNAMQLVHDRVETFACGEGGDGGGVCARNLCTGDGAEKVCGLDAEQVMAILDAIDRHQHVVSRYIGV